MNHKTYRIPAADFALSEEGKGTVIFATLGVVDKDGDITYKNAFGNNQVAHLLPMHVWKDADSPFLGIAKIREDGDKAIADIEINMDTQRGRDWRSSLKFALDRGKDIEWSYGYDVEDSDNPTIDGKKRRGLKSVTVHELSPVVIGAGEDTRTLSMKDHAEPETADEQKGLRFSDHFEHVLDEVQSLLDRSRALAATRAKEGRTLSRANRDRLNRLRDELSALLTETEPESVVTEQPVNEATTINSDGLFAEYLRTQNDVMTALA